MMFVGVRKTHPNKQTHTEIKTDGNSAVERLAAVSSLSKQRIKQAMQKGVVWLSREGNTRRLRRKQTIEVIVGCGEPLEPQQIIIK